MNTKLTLTLILSLAMFAGTAAAAPSIATKCAIAKSKAAGKNALAQVKCWQKAVAAGLDTPDAACLSKAADQLANAIAKAEAKGGCLVEGDTSLLEAAATECAADITGLTPAGGSQCFVGATTAQVTPVSYMGLLGLDAADQLCSDTFVTGAHMCSYTELLAAEAGGDLAGVMDATTFWLERDITVDVGGSPSAPGAGGNCNDWHFTGNHLADGEYVTFSGGVPTYHFDDDTYYDGIDTTHTIAGDLQCDGARSIPCCIPCAP